MGCKNSKPVVTDGDGDEVGNDNTEGTWLYTLTANFFFSLKEKR